MAFNGKEGGVISLSEGSTMTAEYRHQNPDKLKGHFFGKDILNKILEQEGCMGIRIYYGIDSEGVQQLVLAGADNEENDILEIVGDISFPCPDACSSNNPLNS